MNPVVFGIFVLAAFFVGRIYGIVEGQRRRDERIERQRGSEAKTLLEYVRMVWR